MIGPNRLDEGPSDGIQAQKDAEGTPRPRRQPRSSVPQQDGEGRPHQRGIDLCRMQCRTRQTAIAVVEGRGAARGENSRQRPILGANVTPATAIEKTSESPEGDAERQRRRDQVEQVAPGTVVSPPLHQGEAEQSSADSSIENQPTSPQTKRLEPIATGVDLLVELYQVPGSSSDDSEQDQYHGQIGKGIGVQISAPGSATKNPQAGQHSEQHHRSVSKYGEVTKGGRDAKQFSKQGLLLSPLPNRATRHHQERVLQDGPHPMERTGTDRLDRPTPEKSRAGSSMPTTTDFRYPVI